jgi:hypothetical protein
MPIAINGTGTITGISAGGLPDDCIVTADIADNNVTTSKIADANITPAKLAQPLTLETAKAWNWNGLTTNTSLDFTSIPSWVKRVTVVFNGVSTNGTSYYLVQLGTSGGVALSGYISTSNTVNQANGTAGSNNTSGFLLGNGLATQTVSGHMNITTLGSNVWVSSHLCKISTTNLQLGGGDVTLSGTLDRVRITTVNGTDTFDAGSINIMYE